MKLRSQFQPDHCHVISTNTSITSLSSASPNSSAMPSEVFSSRIAMHCRAHQTFFEVGGDMLQHLETLKSAFNDLSMHGSPMTDLQKFDALILSLPHEMEQAKAIFCSWAEVDQTFNNVAKNLCDSYERSLPANEQHQSNGDMFFEARLNKIVKDRDSNVKSCDNGSRPRSQSPIDMVHGSSFSWDIVGRSHFTQPLKNHDKLTLIDAEESSFDEYHEMITNFASFSGFTALNRTVERPLKPKKQRQVANRSIEPVKDRSNLSLKPKLESSFTPANEPIEQVKSSLNSKILSKCPNAKKKFQQLASAVYKIPNKDRGFRRKKIYSSFLCSNRAQRSHSTNLLILQPLLQPVSQVLTTSTGWKLSSRNFHLLNPQVLQRTIRQSYVIELKLNESKPTPHAARSNFAKHLAPDISTKSIATNYDLWTQNLPTKESIELAKSPLSIKIPRISSGPKKKLKEFAFVTFKSPNDERGYRRRRMFSSSLCSNRARRKGRFKMRAVCIV